MSALLELQAKFTELLPRLLDYMRLREVGTDMSHVLAEVYRPPETAALYAQQGRGSKTSLHCEKLAADILIFKKGVLCTTGDEYKVFGAYWKSLHQFARWGGDFTHGPTAGDYGHFSITPDNVRA